MANLGDKAFSYWMDSVVIRMTTKAQRQSKIEFYDLGERILDMIFNKRMSYKEISEELGSEGYDISQSSISVFKQKVVDDAKDFVMRTPEYREKLAKKYLDTVENLVELLIEIKSKIKQYSNNPKQWKAHLGYINAALTELHFILKRAGEIKPSQIIKHQQVNILQINRAVQNEIVRLIDEKDIPLEYCSPRIKELYGKVKR